MKTDSLEVIAIGQARAENELTGSCRMRKEERHEGGVCARHCRRQKADHTVSPLGLWGGTRL